MANPLPATFRGLDSGLLRSPINIGAMWMVIDQTTARWPSDGRGTASVTNTDSVVEASAATLILGLLLKTSDALATDETVTIMKHDGTTTIIAIGIDKGRKSPDWVPFGPSGILADTGISAKVSNVAVVAYVFFLKLD